MLDGLDADVACCMERALAALSKAGAEIVEIDVPEIVESNTVFVAISRPELVATFGRKRFLASKDRMNPDVSVRIAPGLEISTDDYIRSLWRHRDLIREVPRLFGDVDAWVGPAKQRVAPEFPGGFVSVDTDAALLVSRRPDAARQRARPMRIELAVPGLWLTPAGRFPVDAPGGAEHDLLSIALACEDVFGPQGVPRLGAFVGQWAAALCATRRGGGVDLTFATRLAGGSQSECQI